MHIITGGGSRVVHREQVHTSQNCTEKKSRYCSRAVTLTKQSHNHEAVHNKFNYMKIKEIFVNMWQLFVTFSPLFGLQPLRCNYCRRSSFHTSRYDNNFVTSVNGLLEYANAVFVDLIYIMPLEWFCAYKDTYKVLYTS